MLGCWGREVFAEGSIVLPGAGLALFTTLNPIPGLAVCTHFYDKMTNVVTEWMFSESPWTAGTGWGVGEWCMNHTGELLCSLRNF